MTHAEYISLRELVLEIMWQRDLFAEQKADEIMTLFGITVEEPKEAEDGQG